MVRSSVVLAALLAACAVRPRAAAVVEPGASADSGPVYAALPLQNLTADPDAPGEILAGLRILLESRGARFVPAADLERILRANRIRYTDSVSRDQARLIATGTGATHALLGTVIAFERSSHPRISVSFRVLELSSGERVSSAVVSLRGEDFTGAFGLGAIERPLELQSEVLARLASEFDAKGRPACEARSSSASPFGSAPSDALTRFVGPDFQVAAAGKIAVMPLTNRSGRSEAGSILADLTANEWFRGAHTQVVEMSELRSAMIREKLRSIEGIDLDVLSRIGRAVGARYFVLGSVERYEDEVLVDAERFPLIEAFLRVVDVTDGRIVAACGVRRRGDDYVRVLGLGSVRDIVSLGARTTRELLASMEY
jgi:TolB-like protein